jgi:eukaryotic-like serine/threonine-protein kinase
MATPTPPPPVLHQRYRIDSRLGQSRLAVVYRARDERLQRNVLVHLLRQELLDRDALRQRFLEEAQRGAQRSHHGLLEVFDTGDVANRPYMVTEDVEGLPLAERIPLPLPEALAVLRTVVGAVALAQSQGAPHPPVSSRNVWLLDGGRAVLLENWLLAPADAALDLAHYRAPERARGAPPSGTTTVYGLGILSWETLIGERPFTGATPDAIAARQMHEALPSLSDANGRLWVPGLDRVIAGAAAADPAYRYPSPVDYGRALDLFVDQATAQTGRLALLPQPKPQPATRGIGMLRRRGDTATIPIAPPPPPPVLREAPAVARRHVPPMPVLQAPAQADSEQPLSGKALDRVVRTAMRRRSCQRAIVKRTVQILLILALIYGALLGIDAAVARARQVDPRSWVARWVPSLPDGGWLDRVGEVRDMIGRLRPQSTIVVAQPLNLRGGPSTQDQVLRALPEGTELRPIEGPVADAAGNLSWIKVAVVEDGTEGWVADLPGYLNKQ